MSPPPSTDGSSTCSPIPTDHPFVHNEGGYATLNFIPSIATMIFGVLAGELLLSSRRPASTRPGPCCWQVQSCWVLGELLDSTVCPIVKRIWTPTLGHRLDGLDLLDAGGVLLP